MRKPSPPLVRLLSAAAVIAVCLPTTGCALILLGGLGNGAAPEYQVGECYPGLGDAEEGSEVEELDTVDCAQPHELENYSMTDLGEGDFPGTRAVSEATARHCEAVFEEFAGIAYEESELEVFHLEPSEKAWDAGDATAVCLVTDPDGPTTGSLKDALR